jgi:hypothetical protein
MNLKEYLRREFTYNTIPKYYKYFEEWFDNLTEEQKLYYECYMNGQKSPFTSGPN